MRVMRLILALLLLSGGYSELSAGNNGGSTIWNDTQRDAAGNIVQEGAGQVKRVMNKRVTGSQMRKWVPGNSKVRGRAAVRFNSNIKFFKSLDQRHIIRNAGVYVLAADTGATFLGHVYEGDYSGGGAALVNQTAKAGASSVGAMSGGYTGAVAGTFIGGPPGTIIGGAIGAVGGAIAGSSVYEYLVGDRLKKMAEYSLSAPEIDYLEQSRQNLAEFKKKKQAALEELERRKRGEEAADKELMKLAEEGKDLVNFWDTGGDLAEHEVSLGGTTSSLDDILGKIEPVEKEVPKPKKVKKEKKKKSDSKSARREDIKKQKKDLMKKAKQKDLAGIDPNREYSSKPVIEQNCTIDIVIWTSEHPDVRTDYTVYINSGQASSSCNGIIPAYSNNSGSSSSSCAESTWYAESSGNLQGNTLYMIANGNSTHNCVHKGVRSKEPFTCNTEMSWPFQSDDVLTLNIDGTISQRSVSRSNPTMKVWGNNCSWKASDWKKGWKKANADAPKTTQYTGIWQKRQ